MQTAEQTSRFVFFRLRIAILAGVAILASIGSVSAETVTLCGGSGEMFGENESLLLPLDQPGLDNVLTTLVTVDLTIEHDWVGDLWVLLNHAGKDVELLQLPGSPASIYGCGGQDVSITLQDNAPLPAEDACSLTPPAMDGEFAPHGALSDFIGDDPAGFWTLAVIDLGADDCGMLAADGVCVHITYAPDCNQNGIPDSIDILDGGSDDDNGNLIPDECELSGDCDIDGDVDLADYGCYVACHTGPIGSVAPKCELFDFDDDGDVDLYDWGQLQIAFAGR